MADIKLMTCRKRTKEERLLSFNTRVDMAVLNLPDCFYDRVREMIERKIRLPACLIQVRSIAKLALRQCKIKRETMPQLREAAYHVVAQMLEEYGGVMSEFTSHRHSGSRIFDYPPYRRVYKFPPLKERKK